MQISEVFIAEPLIYLAASNCDTLFVHPVPLHFSIPFYEDFYECD